MLNTQCPNCGQRVRASEYTRKRESYLTDFSCPHCQVRLRLAHELYLWIVLIFQVVPVTVLLDLYEVSAHEWLTGLSTVLVVLGCIGLILRFRYERVET